MKCLTCSYVKHGQKSCVIHDKTYNLNSFYNCSTTYVIYCISCPCGLFYVGRTIRALRTRFGEHRRAVHAGDPKSSIARHFAINHHKDISLLRVWVIEAIPETPTAVERFQRLCRQETFWIYSLNTMSPHGLNEEIETNNII